MVSRGLADTSLFIARDRAVPLPLSDFRTAWTPR